MYEKSDGYMVMVHDTLLPRSFLLVNPLLLITFFFFFTVITELILL